MGKNHIALILLVIAGLIASIALLVSGLALVDRFSETNHRRAEIAAAANIECRDIEKLKSALREQENSNFKDLPRNLKLLGIKETPEIDRVARQQHARRLARLAPEACPRQPTRR